MSKTLTRPLLLLMAVTCGVAVANLYYVQPLLHTVAAALHSSPSTAALLVTASQIGYAVGLVFIVPLGDLLDRRRMIPPIMILAALGLVGAAAAPTLAALAAAIAVTGVTSVVAQVLVPFASSLAADEQRGRAVGTVMSGLLIGILLARTVSGLVASVAGWRVVFAVAAGAMLVLAAALARALPTVPPSSELPMATERGARLAGLRPAAPPSYWRLLASLGALLREEPRLRRRMCFGALGMASFTVVWTALALLLSRPPFSYGEAIIGLFGLAGLAGASAAPLAGRLADRGGHRRGTGFFLLSIVLGWGLLALGHRSAMPIVAGLIVIDLGIQGQNILNQTIIYELRPDARSRLTTCYMTGNFLCGAIASAATAWAWSAGGWFAVCGLGGVLSLGALAIWLLDGLGSVDKPGHQLLPAVRELSR
ncbi:MAG TPA: MFS transporter [Solirubrobacteraceae bacterium]|jgi:predicted MFS family arabinose efflux permease|nr:MFS transporter [Solirubrobacteraceae bacterium]